MCSQPIPAETSVLHTKFARYDAEMADPAPHPIPLSEPGRKLVATVAAGLLNTLDEFSKHIDDSVLTEFPEIAGAPEELRESLARSTRAHVALFPGMVGTWADPRSAVAPPEALAWAAEVGRYGLPVETLLRIYRVGHATISQRWLDELSAHATDPAVLAEAASATSAYLFTYVDAVLQPIIAGYIAERERRLSEAQSVRESELRQVLAGDSVDIAQASNRLRYRLDRWHVGFVAWVPDGDPASISRLEPAGRAVAKALGVDEPPLTMAAATQVLYGWVGAWTELSTDPLSAIDGVQVSMGSPGRGLDGFRLSHEQARLARRLSRLRRDGGPATIQYADCDVAALLASDLDQARRFVTSVLGVMADDEPAHRKLLDTVAVYHREGMSISRTAARLGIHANTVTYRVRRVVDASGETDSGSLRLRAAVELAAYVGRSSADLAQ